MDISFAPIQQQLDPRLLQLLLELPHLSSPAAGERVRAHVTQHALPPPILDPSSSELSSISARLVAALLSRLTGDQLVQALLPTYLQLRVGVQTTHGETGLVDLLTGDTYSPGASFAHPLAVVARHPSVLDGVLHLTTPSGFPLSRECSWVYTDELLTTGSPNPYAPDAPSRRKLVQHVYREWQDAYARDAQLQLLGLLTGLCVYATDDLRRIRDDGSWRHAVLTPAMEQRLRASGTTEADAADLLGIDQEPSPRSPR